MPANLLALIIPIFIGCAASAVQQIEQPSAECSADEFRGFGVGENESEALGEAHSVLARQINSSVNVTIERIVNQQMLNGRENLSSEYESRTVIEAALPNAHDARIVRSKRNGNKINVVVCMTKADAAKSFLEKQRLVADSLGLVSNMELSTEHPKHKNEAWRKTQALYNNYMKIQYLLESWGIRSPYLADEIYYKTRENYKNYCQGLKIFWQDTGNECSNAVFSMFSPKIKMEKSQCSGGLNLNFNCQERCKTSHYGVECFYEPSLAIESCNGESYSLLKTSDPIASNDIYNEVKAREKLASNLLNTILFNDWEKEIKKWIPQCTD